MVEPDVEASLLVAEKFEDTFWVFLGDVDAETVLLVEFDAAASGTISRSQSRSEAAGAAVAARAKLGMAAT